MRAEVIATNQSGGNFNYFVSIEGLRPLMRWLSDADPQLRAAIRSGLEDAAQPVLARARANAKAIADDGTFADSLSIKSSAMGLVELKSTDAAAGVKEFAKRGATYRPKPSDKRRNARKMSAFPVGVPRRANPPRAMIPAVNDSADEVRVRIEMQLERVLGRVDG